jgi:hypothetical protein
MMYKRKGGKNNEKYKTILAMAITNFSRVSLVAIGNEPCRNHESRTDARICGG